MTKNMTTLLEKLLLVERVTKTCSFTTHIFLLVLVSHDEFYLGTSTYIHDFCVDKVVLTISYASIISHSNNNDKTSKYS